ncbi:mersacidin/lichenicidin family type 2 lantibiotic [Synechocystis sp. PCC 7509]|uniref:mersacidin/lichenicidin family type 2 lantibiotic n=1 Tax=Synechocystis sp. PCC 7509 TaxID=927677 RepID=UPI0002ABBADC|nr:mersacidin/lichenicidin family type 2 lantibiotic [Synechocystis sp. PCC 7509]
MSNENIIRAWKDREFRNSLSKQESELLPTHPAGLVELIDEDLGAAAGGIRAEDTHYMSKCIVCC